MSWYGRTIDEAAFNTKYSKSVYIRVYLSCWAWSDFNTGGGAPGLFCLAASMSMHPARHLQ
jgi:hypothetical protein